MMSTFNDFNNPQVKNLPEHLRQFIVDQHYESYTPVDQAVWRFVMRQNYHFLKDIAYDLYIPGLAAVGLSIEKIPHLQEMNDALQKIGWGTVRVDGIIPPAVFMEFQSCRVLVMAANIRQLEHIEYTPAQDIIHESAGHAPILADPDYNQYLSYFGSIGVKAMYSSKDYELYEAIRDLSILKEMRNPDPISLKKAEKRVLLRQQNLGDPSEMALLSRLHWWTVEYGLIGPIDHPKVYGAGLLSSIEECKTCMDQTVKKYPYTADAVHFPFDITKPQPQLFVTPDFKNLTKVLEDFADTMAFRRGGSESILKAIECKNTCTAVYSSGLQISGVFQDLRMDKNDELLFIKTVGESALAYRDKQLEGHDKSYHADGFSSPVGRLKNLDKPLEQAEEAELQTLGIIVGNEAELNFCSGLSLHGRVESIIRRDTKILLISFSTCSLVDEQGTVYFDPSWGRYDLAVGEKIVSVYSGAADRHALEEIVPKAKTATYHKEHTNHQKRYHELFRQVRNCRETLSNFERLNLLWEELKEDFRDDWLCAIEILEILELQNKFQDLARQIRIHLEMKASQEKELSQLIHNGFYLIRKIQIQ